MAPRQDRRDRLTGDLVRYERALREQGFTRVAGADEAGRGALAGPLVAAAVVLPDGFDPEGATLGGAVIPDRASRAARSRWV